MPRRSSHRILLAISALSALLLAVCGPAGAASKPAPETTSTGSTTVVGKPTAAVMKAQAEAAMAKAVADAAVTALRARITTGQNALDVLDARAEMAEQQFALQQSSLTGVNEAANRASAAATSAEQAYASAHAALVQAIVNNYKTANNTASAGILVTSADPNVVLQGFSLQARFAARYASYVQADATTKAAKADAERIAAGAAARQRSVTRAARSSLNAASEAASAADKAQALLNAQLQNAKLTQAQTKAALSAAQSYVSAQQSAALLAKYKAIATAVAALPIAPNPGHWTAQMGQSVVDRALQWLGVPYAFAGGNAAGPTIGICGAGNSSNDCHVDGFDCSGLALYSWAPYLSLTHYAATQYVQAGKLHPSVSQLLPGDLVFWSSNATVTGIHHVGIYVGDANIIQAPQSGELVKITPLAAVDSGYYGATRPLS